MSTTTAPTSSRTTELSPAELLQRRADALYRAAAECHRQRSRYACMVEHRCSDTEQRAALRLAQVCDENLVERIGLYDKAAAHCGAGKCGFSDSPWWHKANALWQAAREYERRHQDADRTAGEITEHSAANLAHLAMEFDLEASALLALKHALDGYKACRPNADLGKRPA